jgi:hypothetical protein
MYALHVVGWHTRSNSRFSEAVTLFMCRILGVQDMLRQTAPLATCLPLPVRTVLLKPFQFSTTLPLLCHSRHTKATCLDNISSTRQCTGLAQRLAQRLLVEGQPPHNTPCLTYTIWPLSASEMRSCDKRTPMALQVMLCGFRPRYPRCCRGCPEACFLLRWSNEISSNVSSLRLASTSTF